MVWEGWFWQSIAHWDRLPETEWLALSTPTESKATTPAPSIPQTPISDLTSNPIDEVEGREPSERRVKSMPSANGADKAEDEQPDDVSLQDEGFLEGAGWDDADQAELDAFLEGSSDSGDIEARSERQEYVKLECPGHLLTASAHPALRVHLERESDTRMRSTFRSKPSRIRPEGA